MDQLAVYTQHISTPLGAVLRALARVPLSARTPHHAPSYVFADKRRSGCFYVYEDTDGVWIHGFHLTVKNERYVQVRSPYGYGGPVASTESAAFLHKAWKAWEEWCADLAVSGESMLFHPLAENWRVFNGQAMLTDRQTVWLDLSIPFHYEPRTDAVLSKAEGLTVAPLGVENFGALYRAEMQRKAVDEFYLFSDEYIHAVGGTLLGCRDEEGKLLAGALFLDDGLTAEYHLAAATDAGRASGAPTRLLHEAALHFKTVGNRRLHLGGGRTAGDSLFKFKRGFSPLRGELRTAEVER